jgi:RNA polymerase sigma-70 factor (ECF subfamily)
MVLPFEDVYERYALDVYRFCLFMLRDPAQAEDVAADAFVSAFKAYDRVHPPEDEVRVWLIRIAKNASLGVHRRNARWRRIVTTMRGASAIPAADVESTAETNETIRELQQSIGNLTAKERLLISLRCASDLPYEEIGQITGMSAKAAAMATYRSLERIRSEAKETS